MKNLNHATYRKSPDHSSTGMQSDVFILLPIVSIRFHVLFHSPKRGSFHLSLAVLFAIGDLGVFSLTRWSWRIHTGFHVPHTTWEPNGIESRFNDWAFTIYGAGFSCFVSQEFLYLHVWSKKPEKYIFLLDWSHSARRYFGNRFCFLFLQLLRCFSSLGCLSLLYEFKKECLRLPYSGIFGSKHTSCSPKHIVGYHALHRL